MNEYSEMIPYIQPQLADLSGVTDDISTLSITISEMGSSITSLTDNVNAKIDAVYAYLPVLKPAAIAGGVLIGAYLLTGMISNAMSIGKQGKASK